MKTSKTTIISGVYLLLFPDGCFYVGCSTDIHSRFNGHCNELKSHKHPNKLLQNKYEELRELPVMKVLEFCKGETALFNVERYHIQDQINKRGRCKCLQTYTNPPNIKTTNDEPKTLTIRVPNVRQSDLKIITHMFGSLPAGFAFLVEHSKSEFYKHYYNEGEGEQPTP